MQSKRKRHPSVRAQDRLRRQPHPGTVAGTQAMTAETVSHHVQARRMPWEPQALRMHQILPVVPLGVNRISTDGSSVHFPIRLSDFDLWTVEKRLPLGLFHLSLTALRALPARKADQPDNFITSLCIQCKVMSAPAGRGLIFRN